jgi:hypothetical protein
MKRILKFAGVLVVVATLADCANGAGAPFPSEFERTGENTFRFVATGNWDYPANAKSGETERLAWLGEYMLGHQICPLGLEITARVPERVMMSAKRSVEDQMERSITYLGKCKSPISS